MRQKNAARHMSDRIEHVQLTWIDQDTGHAGLCEQTLPVHVFRVGSVKER